MADASSCSRCGTAMVPASLPHALCPTCLLHFGLPESLDLDGEASLAPGDVVGHYRLLELVDRGAQGRVYRARDLHLPRDVAVKLLPVGVVSSDADRKRFRKEAAALSKLSHPNICTIHDFDTRDGIDFLVMEYVSGPTLAQGLANGPCSEKEIIGVGAQIADALASAHEHGVVHRDLKPANIVFTGRRQVKVLDFGLAHFLSPRSKPSIAGEEVPPPGEIAGTLPYMSPEQFRGEEPDPRSDIYSAGAVLYEMATGLRPFTAPSVPAMMDAIRERPPIPPHSNGARISHELERIILKCLEKDVDDRYQSAQELSIDLRRLSSAPTHDERQSRRRRRLLWRTIVPTVLLTAATVWVVVHPDRVRDWLRGIRPGAIRSLAVLPFASLTHDSGQDYFADGMTEAIITSLGKIPGLNVLSTTSAMHYKKTNKLLPDIARELHVDALVEGSVFRDGDRVRITAKLVRAHPEKQVWSNDYTRDAGDVVALQNEVALAIAEAVFGKLTAAEKNRLDARSVDREAHDAYLRGRWHWNKRTGDGFAKAVEYFQKAIARDSTYALAYAGLADAYALFGSIGYDVLPPRQAAALARPAAQRAVDLDPSLAEARCALAHILHNHDRDARRAENEFRRAIELNPGYATAHQWYAFVHASCGRLDAAEDEARRAQELDPRSPVIDATLGRILYYERQYDAAATELLKALDLDASYAAAHLLLGMTHRHRGQLADALASFQRGRELAPGSMAFLAAIGSIYALSDRKEDAQRIVDEMVGSARERYVPAYYIGALYLDLGEVDRAMEWFDRACEESSEAMLYLQVDPILDRVRTDERFRALVQRVGLPVS